MSQPLYPLEGESLPTVPWAGLVSASVWTGKENIGLTGFRTPERPSL